MRLTFSTWRFTMYDVPLALQRKRFFVHPSAHSPDHHSAWVLYQAPGGIHHLPGLEGGTVGGFA